jgi:hypothetical protein
MPKARLALIAAAALALLCVPLAFVAGRPSPAIELHFLGGDQVGDSFHATFGISNHTGLQYSIRPLRLETLEGGAWKELKRGVGGFSGPEGLGLLVDPAITCIIQHVPQSHLRLVAQSTRERVGQDTLLIRARMFLSAESRRNAFLPFKTKFYEDTQTISDEFTLP